MADVLYAQDGGRVICRYESNQHGSMILIMIVIAVLQGVFCRRICWFIRAALTCHTRATICAFRNSAAADAAACCNKAALASSRSNLSAVAADLQYLNNCAVS